MRSGSAAWPPLPPRLKPIVEAEYPRYSAAEMARRSGQASLVDHGREGLKIVHPVHRHSLAEWKIISHSDLILSMVAGA